MAVADGITAWPENRSGMPFIYLASRSPRRRLLLAQLGVAYETLDIAVDEGWDGREIPGRYVCRLALAKAQAGRLVPGACLAPILGADTAVVLDGAILGKPEGPEEALAMLARLSGRRHEVYTAGPVAPWRVRALGAGFEPEPRVLQAPHGCRAARLRL